MARIIFPADNVGEAKAYIKALTGAQNITIPAAPSATALGQVMKVESKFVSVAGSADIGFGFGSVGTDTDVKVLLQDYWFLKEVEGTIPEVNSWTFAAGFRVGLRIVGFSVKLDVGVGALAAKAQTEGLNVQLQVLRVGMPEGPNLPISLAMPASLDVDKFGELKSWEGEVLKYVEEHRADLAPVLVSASVNIPGEKLLKEFPAGRYSLWRIVNEETLTEALAHLAAGKAPEVGPSEVRAVYSAVFNDPTMVIPGQASEKRKPGRAEIEQAKDWLMGYKKLK